jgi:predicted dehydrogenase
MVTHPLFIECNRLSPFPDRSTDIDVVLDLMIHDLDIILSLVGSEVASIRAVGIPVISRSVDIANARLEFASGCVANITASRISIKRERKIRLFQPDSYLSLDYQEQELHAYRLVPDPKRPDGRPKVEGGKVKVDKEEPLKVELEAFLHSVVTRERPLVSGEEARAALAVALEVGREISRSLARAGGGTA